MRNQDITLFISEDRAARIARQFLKSNETFEITRGTVRWDDYTFDHGFRVKIVDERGRFQRFL
ncbi:hypothetical protein [Mesorhizobium sp.]|uniref:hypothetical protein n=1 Tax=Mesorhizobium sp. TaxID=1871066 RepID=UPI000FE56D83|nr:hypothetical protein [Mesorhizobium sp.]RWM84296.1 MAG: hypothetical protein EOR83_16875 [Mesorhizobium sp.]